MNLLRIAKKVKNEREKVVGLILRKIFVISLRDIFWEIVMFKESIFSVLLFVFLPDPERIKFLSGGCYHVYFHFFQKTKAKVVAYHKACLMDLDSNYRTYVESLDLVKRRNEALEREVGPSDPEYPVE